MERSFISNSYTWLRMQPQVMQGIIQRTGNPNKAIHIIGTAQALPNIHLILCIYTEKCKLDSSCCSISIFI